MNTSEDFLRRLGAQLSYNEERFFLILAIFIGIFAGLAVVCFRITMEWTHLLLLGSSITPTIMRGFLVPALAGLILSALVLWIFPGARGSGLNQTKAALYVSDGYIPFRTVIGKFVTATLAIGSGFSLGPEDPSLQIGAGLASAFGQRLRLSRKKQRLLAPIGAAAGLAAAFNAPISAVLFVIEEVIGRWSAGILGAVVLSAVASVVTMRSFLGAEAIFRIPPTNVSSWQELLAYAVLGVLGGCASVVFSQAIGWLRPKLKAWPAPFRFAQPALAGLILGAIAAAGFPQVMGAGYQFMEQAMHDQYTWQFLGMLAGLKIIATTISYVSGTPGGMFAPTMFVGAMLGGSVGTVAQMFFPNLTGSVGTYALVGIGVLFAGFLRAPITSIFMALEVSGDYSIILPVLVANVFSYLISRQLQKVPILEVITRQDGLYLPAMEEEREQESLLVEDAMRVPTHVPLSSGVTVTQARALMGNDSEKYLLVLPSPTAWGGVGADELEEFERKGKGEETIHAVLQHRAIPHLYSDQDLDVALRYTQEWPLIPVVRRTNISQIQGVVNLADVLHAYRQTGTG
jgi:CIC family chloride channel protein